MSKNYYPILTSAQMRLCDSYTSNELGLSARTLMERAARAVVDVVLNPENKIIADNILVLCGCGNNGGDGFASARILKSIKNCIITVCYVGPLLPDGSADTDEMSDECAYQYNLALNSSIDIIPITALTDEYISNATCVIDAIFGIGLTRNIVGDICSLIGKVNESNKTVIAIDTPSGINADNGQICGTIVHATLTVCIQCIKPGLLLFPGTEYVGKIVIPDIGIDTSPVKNQEYAKLFAMQELKNHFVRSRRTNKGSYGRVLLVCGSSGMSGAAYFATSAALRCGAGLAHIFTHSDNRIILQIQLPEAIMSVYSSAEDSLDSKTLYSMFDTADVIVAGCGLGRSNTSYLIMQHLVNHISTIPLVLDADALNIMSEHSDLWKGSRFEHNDSIIVVTPHLAELSRIMHIPICDIKNDLVYCAKNFAKEKGVWVVLKDAYTFISSPEGELYINVSGNSGMACGGSGDALAGIIGAMLANLPQNYDSSTITETLAAAVSLHATAGDKASDRYGEVSMLPTDLIAAISEVTKDFNDTKKQLIFN